MDTLFRFNVEAERVGSHVLINWSNPIVGFGSFDICTETGMVYSDEVGKELTYKIINDWLRPVTSSTKGATCHEIIEYDYVLKDGTKGIVVSYVFKNEDTSEFESNRIVIVSKTEETFVYQGILRHIMPNVYQARRYVKEYLSSAGITVLQR